MEILSDATFKGNVRVNGDFSVNYPGESSPFIQTNENGYVLSVKGSEYVGGITVGHHAHFYSNLNVDGNLHVSGCIIGSSITGSSITLSNSTISCWTEIACYISIPKPVTFASPTIPANCTAFEFVGSSYVSTDEDHLIQVKNASNGKSVIAETWITSNNKPAMSFAGCTSTIAEGTYKAVVF